MRKLFLTALTFMLGSSITPANGSYRQYRDTYKQSNKLNLVKKKSKYELCACGLKYRKGTKCRCLKKEQSTIRKQVAPVKKAAKTKVTKYITCETCGLKFLRNKKNRHRCIITEPVVKKTGTKKAKKITQPRVKKVKKCRCCPTCTCPKGKCNCHPANPHKKTMCKKCNMSKKECTCHLAKSKSRKKAICKKCGMRKAKCSCHKSNTHKKIMCKKCNMSKKECTCHLAKNKSRKKAICKKCGMRKAKCICHNHTKPVKGCPYCKLPITRCRCMV